MKNIWKKIAKYIVVIYSRRQYNKAVKLADKQHLIDKKMYYATLAPYNKKRLIIVNRNQFRAIKRKLKIYDRAHGSLQLRDGCFYHTPDAGEDKRLSASEVEVRRIAFIKYILTNAKLNDV